MKDYEMPIGEHNIPIRISEAIDTMVIWQKTPVNKLIFPLYKQIYVIKYWNISTGEIRGHWEKWVE